MAVSSAHEDEKNRMRDAKRGNTLRCRVRENERKAGRCADESGSLKNRWKNRRQNVRVR